jgi:hypothetical protein
MPTITQAEALSKLADAVQGIDRLELAELYDELYPGKPMPANYTTSEAAKLIREGLEPLDLIDLWNVTFPEHEDVRFDEETHQLSFELETPDYAEIG